VWEYLKLARARVGVGQGQACSKEVNGVAWQKEGVGGGNFATLGRARSSINRRAQNRAKIEAVRYRVSPPTLKLRWTGVGPAKRDHNGKAHAS